MLKKTSNKPLPDHQLRLHLYTSVTLAHLRVVCESFVKLVWSFCSLVKRVISDFVHLEDIHTHVQTTSLPLSPVTTDNWQCTLSCCHSSVWSTSRLGIFSWYMTNVAAVPPDSYSQVILWFRHIHTFMGHIVETNQIFEYKPPVGRTQLRTCMLLY